MNNFFQSPFAKGLLFFIALYLFLPGSLASGSYLCELDSVNINSCLDESWTLAINWAVQKNLIFGKDFVFTYGPLGFLSTRVNLGFTPYYFLFFDFFVLGNLAFILLYVFRKFYSLPVAGICLLVIITLSGTATFHEQVVFVLLLISIFWLHYSIKHLKTASLIVPVLISCLLFYIKVNISFVAIVIFYLYLFYYIITVKESRFSKILYALAVPFLIVLLSLPLNVDLPGYVLGSLSLIDGYNDAMNSRPREFASYPFVGALILVIFFIFLFATFKRVKENFLLFLVCGIFSFVLFKQSFVRADWHVTAFFSMFPGLCGLLMIFYQEISALQIRLLAGICAICLTVGLIIGAYSSPLSRVNYFSDIFSGASSLQTRYEKSFNRFDLPGEVKEIIGTKSVDVVPWNIDMLYFNRLNYNPRPVIQSYSVYTSYLIKLNEQKYLDDSAAPDFVLFSNLTIDGRYALFDDMGVKLSLIRNYSPVGLYNSQDQDFLLFQKNSRNATINLSPPVEETVKFGQEYFLKDSGKPYFIRMNVDYSLPGKAVRFFFKPFQISIYFTFVDGTVKWHRAIIPILKNGVLINPYIENEGDFLNFAKDGFSPADTKKIKSFRIELDASKSIVKTVASKTYESEVKLSVSEVNINKND